MKRDPYQKISKIYDKLFEPSIQILRKMGLQLCPPTNNQSILDIGCGTGTQLALYNKKGCTLHGIDTSPAMLEKAEHKLGNNATLVQMDATKMKFSDNKFDLVSIILVLHELNNELRLPIIMEAKRVLKKNGILLVIDFSYGPYPIPMGFFWRSFRTFSEVMGGRVHYANYTDFKHRHGVEPLIYKANLIVNLKQPSKDGVATVYCIKKMNPEIKPL